MSEHRIQVAPTDRTVLVPDNANLREVCLREGVPLYFGLGRLANCGGRGRCGTCLVQVLAGSPNLAGPTPREQERLRSYGPRFRLACQVQIRGPASFDPRG